MKTRCIGSRGIAASLLLTLALLCSSIAVYAPSAHADALPEASRDETPLLGAAITGKLNEAIAQEHEATMLETLADDSRAGDFYFAQTGSGRCTITSVAMMVRRAAFLDERADWQNVTLSSVTGDGWSSAGVKWNFSTAGYNVSKIGISGTTDALIELLAEHPEGIAVYDTGVPHAVLLTDYDAATGTFYCADPASYYAGSRIPLADSWNGSVRGGQAGAIAGFSSAWVIQ